MKKLLPHVRTRHAIQQVSGQACHVGCENAEYHGQREEQARVAAKIAELKTQLANCDIVDKSKLPRDQVNFGSLVTVKDMSDGLEEKYELVGPGEEDYDGEIMKILTSSPVAQAMIGKKVGDQVETEIPNGTLRLEITAIEFSED